MNGGCDSILRALADPGLLLSMDLSDWDLFIRQARRANLLSRFAVILRDQGRLQSVPARVRVHLESECALADQQKRVVEWEIGCIRQALDAIDVPLVLLKGAAYVAAALPAAHGRRFSDVDILVPRARLAEVEQVLFLHGWFSEKQDAYDQKYYRKWMHEIPPLRHNQRRTVIDVHHAIVPRTMRLHPDPDKLMASTRAVDEDERLRVLSPADMVLHSAAHLFLDGEYSNALRDLVDMDQLVRYFACQEEFWDVLLERSIELELDGPLYYTIHYLRKLLGTPVPGQLVERLDGRPAGGLPRRWLMPLFDRAVIAHHLSCSDHLAGIARWMLYVRGHYLRMPLYLLVPHLLRKSLRAPSGEA